MTTKNMKKPVDTTFLVPISITPILWIDIGKGWCSQCISIQSIGAIDGEYSKKLKYEPYEPNYEGSTIIGNSEFNIGLIFMLKWYIDFPLAIHVDTLWSVDYFSRISIHLLFLELCSTSDMD